MVFGEGKLLNLLIIVTNLRVFFNFISIKNFDITLMK